MQLRWYPDGEEDASSSAVWRSLKKELAKRKDLMLKVETFLLTVKALTDLQDLLKSGQIAALGDSLYEMRIPKTLKGGVVRIYFCHASENPQILFLLEAEFKHDKEAQKIPSARKRLTEYQEIEKRRTR